MFNLNRILSVGELILIETILVCALTIFLYIRT